jgi:GNAT superfamily N-acetyltransferase
MIEVKRTNSQNEDFIQLVTALDRDLAIRDGDEHGFYAQFNKIANLNHVVVLYNNNIPVACGAIKPYESNCMEVKRIFVPETERGKGWASMVLTELEKWALELGTSKLILETGLKQPEAIAFYRKNNYTVIPNYGQYANIENSVCFEKNL